ncbi:hypothetical protein ACFYUY_01735 [Kitasatospora sp. NPDC004745]
MQMSLFPATDLTVDATPSEAQPEPELTEAPLLTVIPGQLDLFTGEEAA